MSAGNSLILPLGIKFVLFANSVVFLAPPLNIRRTTFCPISKGIPIIPVPIKKPKASPGSTSIPKNCVPVILFSRNIFCDEW